MLRGKKLSILGDSISTYRGISNDITANATLRYNPYYYREPFLPEETYWMHLIKRLGLTLCVNNSWSGGNLTGRDDDPDAGVNRAHHLARDDGEAPDLVIVFMGINDLGRGVDPEVFARDYERALFTIRGDHPSAAICCVNLPDRHPTLEERTECFNERIRAAAEKAGDSVFVADLFQSPLNNFVYYNNSVDGLHPDKDGMRMIADVIEAAIREKYRS